MASHLNIEPDVCAALGLSSDELADLTLSAFMRLAIDKGYIVTESGWGDKVQDGSGCLTVKMDNSSKQTNT